MMALILFQIKKDISLEKLQKEKRVSIDQLVEVKRGFNVTPPRNKTAVRKYLATKVGKY